MATIIEAIAADGRVARIELAGKDLSFPVDPGVRYRVIDGNSGEMPDALSLRREGGDLLVNGLPDGERVRIEGFFTDCGTESCEFSLGESGESIRPGSEPVAALKDGSFLMWASEGTVSTLPEAPESEFNWRPVAGIGAGLAVIGAGAGGGGGGGGPVDTTAPDAPAIKTPAATNNPFPSISGTAEPGSTITLTIDIGGTGNRVSYSTTVNGDGQWVIDTAQQTPFAGAMPATGLPADQPSTLQAIATDSAGLSSTVSSSQISIDLTPPEQVAKITAAASDAAAPLDDQGVAINTNGAVLEPGPLVDGAQTNDRSPTFSGTIDAALADGDRVAIYRDGALVGEATLNGLQWTFTDPNAPAGTHVYEARTADAAGNVAASGNTFTLTIDGTAPLSPVVAAVAGDDIIDFLEADAGVSISGTAEAGSRVRITWGDVVRLVQVDGTGQFTTSYSREQLPGDGAIPIAAVAIDSFGNQSPVALHPVNLVTHLPDAPVINTANGILAGSPMAINALEAANIAITGTATPGNRVSLTFTPDNGGPALRFEGDAGLNGQFSVPIARNALPDGQYQVRAVSTDIVGNSANGNQNLSVLVDTRAPTALVGFDSATDDAPRITGSLTSGAVTNDTSPTLTGALPAALASGDKIMVLRDGVEIGQAQIQGNQFVFTDGGLADGRYAYAARLIDAAGNAGNEGSFFELQIDATPPAAPTIAVVAGNDVVVAGEAPGGVTVSGSAAPGVAVELDWNGQTRTVTSDAGGQWSALFGNFPQGVHDIRASVVDVAGNVATTTRRVTVDTVAPAAPQIFAPEGGDNVVNSAEAAGGIGISGRAEAGARIELNWGGRSATATANAQGNWSTSFSSPPGQGQSTITAVAVDGVGNRSAQGSRTVTVDTVAPAPPGINAVSVDDRITVADLAGGITISGNTEGGAQVLVSWAGVTRQTTASGGGSWSVNYADAPLQGPSTITARATDGAGNTGATASRNVTANTIPPPPPPGVDTVAGDNIVNDAEKRAGVTITGAAQAGATVEVLWGGETQTTTANGAGRWQVGFARGDVPSDGDTTVRVTATNSGGTSAATSLGVEVDTDAPGRPGVTAAGNNVVSAAEGVNPILVTGATEAGATVTVTWGGVQLTDVADGSGQWAVTYGTLPVGEGTSRIDAFATDVAGNQGALTRQSVTVQDQFPTTAVTITAIQDDQPPFIGNVAPGGVTNDATPTLTLTLNSLLQADESVVIRRNGAVVDTSSPGGNSFTFENEALTDGAYTFTAQVTNAGGLTGPLSPEYAISVAIL